jgi:DNA (cytosine-5)-methyltransferase 1
MAGKRLGKEDERHLWPEMLRAIREIAPRYVVGENVLGLTNWNGGMVFDEVHSDLESAGYEVQAVVIPAAAVNAPHGRDRVWFVAQNTMRGGCTHRKPEQERTGVWEQRNVSTGSSDGVYLSEGLTADTDSNGQHWRNSEHEVFAGEGRLDALGDIGTGSEHGLTADTGCTGWKKHNPSGESNEPQFASRVCIEERGNWQNFPTQSPICGGNDGLPAELDGITFSKWRNESIKAYGNAVVPQVVFQIFKAIAAIDRQEVNP